MTQQADFAWFLHSAHKYLKLNYLYQINNVYKDSLHMFELILIGNQSANDLADCGSKAETILDDCYSVQFFLNGKAPSYIFKLHNNSSSKPYILVKQDSSVFKGLNVGDILDMEYNKAESLDNGKFFKTVITSKISHDRYNGHSIVELSIINN